jgi:AraC-like DNA-binding protein
MDALSDVLKSIRLEGGVYVNAEFTAPFCVQANFGPVGLQMRMGGAEQVMHFHYILEGSCKLGCGEGKEVMTLNAGDLVLFLDEDPHLLASHLHLPVVKSDTLITPEDAEVGFFHMRHGGGGTPTRFVCGFLSCKRSVCRPLLDALPTTLRISVGDGPAATMLRELLQIGVRESASVKPGAESMLAKLSELMFVEAMRIHVDSMPPENLGWLAGVRDPHVGKALALMHAEPGRAWSVEELGREVALSRSALAERFTALVGESPMQYLTRWRLALAAQMLKAGEAIGRIAERSGYESEAAFSRAFKREFGVPPAAWRKGIVEAQT